MSWDNEKILYLIKEYEKRPILWKKDDKLYYNIIKKEDAWREMSVIFEETIDFLKKKMESLRGSRRREKNRVLKSMGTGKGQKDIYISNWFAWESLKFLDDPEQLRETISNHSALENEERDEDNTVNTQQQNFDPIEVDDENDSGQKSPKTSTLVSPNKGFVSPKNPLTKRKRNEDPRIQEAYNILKSKQTEKKDKCAIFGDYIAEKMRKLEERTQAILEHQIHSLIFQAEIGTPQISVQSPIPTSSTQLNPFALTHSSTSSTLNFSPASQYRASPLQSPPDHSLHSSQSPVSSYGASPLQSPSNHSLHSSPSPVASYCASPLQSPPNHSLHSSQSTASSDSASPLQSPKNKDKEQTSQQQYNEHTSQHNNEQQNNKDTYERQYENTIPQRQDVDSYQSLHTHFPSFSNVTEEMK